MRLDRLQRGLDADVDAAPRELPAPRSRRGVVGSREDLRRRVDEHPVLASSRSVGSSGRVADEIRQFCQRFDAA
jgi:hypothetical protein